MRLLTFLAFVFACCAALADAPFPNNPKNRWVYDSMGAIKKEKLWYRFNEGIPQHPVPTREDMATKVLYLAVDSKTLIDALQNSVAMTSQPAEDRQTQQWAKKFAATFPAKKVKYQTHLRRVTRLWNYFKPEVNVVAARLHVNASALGKQLASEQRQLDHIHLRE